MLLCISDGTHRHYLCSTHSSNLNRHLSVNNLTQRAARAEANLISSKLQPITRSKSTLSVHKADVGNHGNKSSKSRASRTSATRPAASSSLGFTSNEAVLSAVQKESDVKRASSSPKVLEIQAREIAAKVTRTDGDSNRSFDSDKNSVVNSNFVPSDTSTAGSVKSSEAKSCEKHRGFLLPRNQSLARPLKEVVGSRGPGKEAQLTKRNVSKLNESFMKSSASSLNDNETDLIEFEDSLQESFDSDR